MLDFTMKKYDFFCGQMIKLGYKFYAIEDYFTSDLEEPFVILRHDVDRSPPKALLIAKIENSHNIKSTFNFRTVGRLFDEKVILEILSLGHEIGYHYEVLVQAKGNHEEAGIKFGKDMLKFDSIGVKVKTATFHGSPFSKYDSRDIWDTLDYKDFGLIGLGFDSVDTSNMYYVTDTARTFGESSANIRDRPRTSYLFDSKIKGSSDIISLAKEKQCNFYIVTHPVRWATGYSDWVWELIFQNSKNIFKRILSYRRGLVKP